MGSGLYPICRMGMWMTWKGTLYMEWDCGWFRKVLRVQYG
jgi:hypothetical protein